MNPLNKLFKIIIFSVLETATIGLLWDVLFDKGLIIIAALTTFLLIAIEHVMARNTADNLALFANFGHRFAAQAFLGATEMVFWTIWRLIHEKGPAAIGPVIALVIFSLLLTVQHNAEQNLNSDKKLFQRLIRSQGLTISIIEASTALAWLLVDDIGTGHRLLATVPLLLGLTVEHVVREFGEPAGVNF
jgi:hypothetical protein